MSVPSDIQDDEIKGYLYLELGSTIHLPFEEPVFDFYMLEKNGKNRDLLLFAAPEQYVMEYANLFSTLKLTPVVADISPLALYRLYHQLNQPAKNEVLFSAQFDLTSVNMSIFEGTVPLVMRQFPLSFDIDKWEMKRDDTGTVHFKYIGDTEDLVYQFEDILKEINKLSDYYRYSLSKEKRAVSKFLINGDHPLLQAILDEMKERLEVPVEMISLELGAKDKGGSTPAKLFLSLGLALKEVQ